jgi:phage gpG-like protein
MPGRIKMRKGAKMKRVEDALRNPKRALNMIGALGVALSQQAFDRQRYGDERWPPRGKINLFGILADFDRSDSPPPGRRFRERPALKDTGRLLGSINFRVSGDAVSIGSNQPYAPLHQKGGTTQSVKVTDTVAARLWGWLQKQGPELRKQLGWVLNKKFRGKRIRGQVPARPFVGITRQLRKDVKSVVGVAIFEVR